MKNFYGIVFLSITLILTSCSFFSPIATEPEQQYVLHTLPPPQIKKMKKAITLYVSEPETNSFYQTHNIAYSVSPYQRAYFAKSAWASTPSEMIHPLLVETLRNTHYFRAVVASPTIGRYDYQLNTRIEELLEDYSHCNHYFLRLVVNANVVRVKDAKIIATKQFIIIEPIFQKTPFSGVYAANQATANMLQKVASFCIKTI